MIAEATTLYARQEVSDVIPGTKIRKDMKLTKQDYMRLPKERLAELLVELQNEVREVDEIEFAPCVPIQVAPNTTPWWQEPHKYEITCQN